jgi:DNA-binding transcriptional regulator LsrR (DeoR family)
MTTWSESDDRELRDRAKALELRYAYGLSKDDVAERMGMPRIDLNNLIERAKHHLRGEVG